MIFTLILQGATITMSTLNSEPAPAARQFDFWLGDWDLTWDHGGCGYNKVQAKWHGRVIEENFHEIAPMNLEAMSLSVYKPDTGYWYQTWVDNQGNYLDFIGQFKEGEMVLERDTFIRGKAVKQRLVWSNIKANSLDWEWQLSEDDGEHWKTLWHIRYRRRGA